METILKRIPDSAMHPETLTDDGHRAPAAAFYLTLAPVAAPITLPQPKSAGLQRYRFFFTSRLEAGRERRWLHLGYFPTAVEANKWLEVLRRVYPYAVARTVPA